MDSNPFQNGRPRHWQSRSQSPCQWMCDYIKRPFNGHLRGARLLRIDRNSDGGSDVSLPERHQPQQPHLRTARPTSASATVLLRQYTAEIPNSKSVMRFKLCWRTTKQTYAVCCEYPRPLSGSNSIPVHKLALPLSPWRRYRITLMYDYTKACTTYHELDRCHHATRMLPIDSQRA